MRNLVFLVFFLFSCQKAADRSCWKFTGAETNKVVSLGEFDRLQVGPYMDFLLVQDSLNFVEIIGGENLVNFVTVDLVEGQLQIFNKNKCRFLRSQKKKILVKIHFTALKEVIFEGSGEMKNEGILQMHDFVLTLQEGSGTVDLQLNGDHLNVSAEPSWANYILAGHFEKANITVKGNAYGDTRNLQVDSSLTVVSRSAASLHINANACSILQGETWSNGNVYYYGTPQAMKWQNFGKGKLLLGD